MDRPLTFDGVVSTFRAQAFDLLGREDIPRDLFWRDMQFRPVLSTISSNRGSQKDAALNGGLSLSGTPSDLLFAGTAVRIFRVHGNEAVLSCVSMLFKCKCWMPHVSKRSSLNVGPTACFER